MNLSSVFQNTSDVQFGLLTNTTLDITDHTDQFWTLNWTHEVAFLNAVNHLYRAISVIGLFGNLLVIFALLKNQGMRTVTNIHILNLSLIDMATLTSVLFPDTQPWPFSSRLCTVYIAATLTTDFAGSTQIAALSLDRLTAICFPLYAAKHRTQRKAIFVCICVWLHSFCIGLPEASNSDINEVGICDASWSSENARFFYNFTFGFLMPVAVITTSYIWIIIKVRSLRFADRNQRRVRRVTNLVVVIIGVYLLLWLPYWIVIILTEVLQTDLPKLVALTEFLSYINSAVNPLLYAFVSKDFRRYMLTLASFRAIVLTKSESDRDNAISNDGKTTLRVETRLCCESQLN